MVQFSAFMPFAYITGRRIRRYRTQEERFDDLEMAVAQLSIQMALVGAGVGVLLLKVFGI